MNPFLQRIRAECSGPAALNLVADITRFHRIQASPGYRQAANLIFERLKSWQLPAEILSYPADFATVYLGNPMFQEWEARRASLQLVSPEPENKSAQGKLADYRATPMSLIQRSCAFEGECELVVLDKGEELQDYAGLDVRSKIVLTNGNLMRVYALAVAKFGAAGILFDGMSISEPVRPPMALPDAIQYTSFWWSQQDQPCFGFALSPRRGQWLRDLARRESARQQSIRLQAQVEARLYDGSIEDIVAFIPGQTSEEVLIVAHLCHPQPSANDNASGAAAAAEAARALQTLIASGQIPTPKRGIRFIWAPEMTGTFAYLSSRMETRSQIIAGLNLDMVGEDQDQTGSVMIVERPSEALPSFAPDLLERLREVYFDGKGLAEGVALPLFRHAVASFSGGSDHYILSDPQIGIPTPMVIQWPDKFYHTTADSLDKVSPISLERAAGLTASYAYWLASAGPDEALWLAHEMNTRFKQRLTQRAQTCLTAARNGEGSDRASGPHLRCQIDFRLERQNCALDSLARLGLLDARPFKDEASRFAEGEWNRCRTILDESPRAIVDESPEATVGEPPDAIQDLPAEIATRRPRRLYPAPVQERFYVRNLSEDEREAYWTFEKHERSGHTLQTIAMYWADGQRSLAEIVDIVELESGQRKAQMLAEYFEWMEKLGLVTF